MNMSRQRLIVIAAVLAFGGYLGTPAAAEQPKAGKIVKTTGFAGVVGGGIVSTKASGAAKVAKARTCTGDAPQIKTVSPDEGRTGDKVTITGTHFGAAGCVSGVSFGPGGPAKFTQVDDRTVTTVVPGGKRGIELLSLTNSTGGDSKPFLRK